MFPKIFRRKRTTTDFSEEIQAHINLEIERLREQGLSEEAAQAAAYRQFGSARRARETFYESHRWLFWDHLVQDVRFGLRTLRKSPGFTTVAILTLALGIGANTAVFSVINFTMLRALPVRDPGQLFLLRWHAKGPDRAFGIYEANCLANPAASTHANATWCSFSYPMYQQIEAQQAAFSEVAAFAPRAMLHIRANDSQALARATLVSGNYFSLLGVAAAVGRVIDRSDDSYAAAPVVVLSYKFWQREFRSDPRVVGTIIPIENSTATIVGVASPSFVGLDPGMRVDAWIPFSAQTAIGGANTFDENDPHQVWVQILARSRKGIGADQAASAASVIFARTAVAQDIFKENDEPRIELVGLSRGLITLRRMYSQQLFLLMGAVGLILLLACANIGGLALARTDARRKEIAVRLALGASRRRVIRQLLIENLVLALAGGTAAIAVAYWCARGLAFELVTRSSFGHSTELRPQVDAHVLGFAFLAATVAGLLFGVSPALRETRVDLAPTLKSAGANSGGLSGGRRFGLGGGLVVAQVTLTVVLLAGAGLLVRTLVALETQKLGFDADNVLLFQVEREWEPHQPETLSGPEIQAVHDELPQRLAALPGVISATYSMTPLVGGWSSRSLYALPGAPRESAVDSRDLDVGPNFFSTMHIPLIAGRDFAAQDFNYCGYAHCDTKGAPSPVIINRALERALFGNANPLGGEFLNPDDKSKRLLQVVGVVEDTQYYDLRAGVLPVCYGTLNYSYGYFELRTAVDPVSLIPAVREALKSASSHVVAETFQTQKESIAETYSQEQLLAWLSGLFAVGALALACIGIYGLLAYEVGRRTPEIGLRVALGAKPRDISRLVVGRGILLAVVGLLLGSALALAITRFLNSLLFGVRPTDPATLIGVAVLLLAVALGAMYIPARRAMRVDPMIALRYE
jgi:predicted permease